MTLTLARRPAPILALLDDRDTGWRGSEAAYAERMRALMVAERRRGVLPPSPRPEPGDRAAVLQATRAGRVLWALARLGRPARRTDIRDHTGLDSEALRRTLLPLLAEGLISCTPAPTRNHPHRAFYALTEAGQRRAGA